MVYKRKNIGTCSVATTITVDGDTITDIRFLAGCEGNLDGISRLCVGRKVDDVLNLLEGVRCGGKKTSCPDQLSKALRELKELPEYQASLKN